jgi:hypothetical protein
MPTSPARSGTDLRRDAVAVSCRVAGGLVDVAAAGFGLVARLRHGKALHPVGTVLGGILVRRGLTPGVGVEWLDRPGEDEVVLRFSRATAVPAPLPDVLGLAIRTPGPGGHPQDLLLSTTGRRPLLRHVLLPHRGAQGAGYTCVVPFRTPTGPLMVGAFPVAGGAFSLQVARLSGPWREFALLLPDDESDAASDEDVDFDPVRHPVAGLRMPLPLAVVRRAVYAGSRCGRGAAG